MTLTKDSISRALQGVTPPGAAADLVRSGSLLSSSVCENYIAVKLRLAPDSPRAILDDTARRIFGALISANGGPIDSLTIEFVDRAGAPVHSARFGSQAGGFPAPPASPPSPAGEGGGRASEAAGNSPPWAPPAAVSGHKPLAGIGVEPGGRAATPQQHTSALPGVKHTIAVGAGKGGVGKSTIALNLAVGLARRGFSVGLMDGDIYGPSMPTMLDLGSLDANVVRGKLQPFYTHGIKVTTIGKLVDPDKPLIWRGPMAHGAFKQLTEQTEWGELDYLIIDLPPGTGDVALTMAQTLQLTGAVVVCTPQKVAQDDAIRASRMFQQLGIELLGVVENMSSFIADDGKSYDIFGRGGAEMMAQRLGVPFLGRIPITMSLRENSDLGNPTANFTETRSPADKALAKTLETLVDNTLAQCALASMRQGQTRPTLTIS